MSYNIAIDGPAGAGKSTIARKLAQKMQFVYVDTGAMYRALGLYFLRNGISPDNGEELSRACEKADVEIKYMDGEQQVILNGENVNGLIRTEEVGKITSACAANADVRKKLTQLQRRLAEKTDVIMDGRDIGTAILPNADVKIYLTASSKERAKRRWKELTEKGIKCDIDEIEKDIINRDNQDMNREISPLKQAEDAVLLDSSDMGIEKVIDRMMEIIEEKKKE